MRFIYIVIFSYFFVGCSSDINEGSIVKGNSLISFNTPKNFPRPTFDFKKRPLNKKVIALGKKLFFDGILSSDGTISCASCHHQSNAFADKGRRVSSGVRGQLGERNASPIQNVAFMSVFTWDGAINHIDVFPIVPITSKVEMNETLAGILKKLKANEVYRRSFSECFNDKKINVANTFIALSQFMLTMVSANSKYDRYIRKEKGIVFTSEELQGKKIFEEKCASCHSGALFSNEGFKNIGLPQAQNDDVGYARVSGRIKDSYKFRIPSLRNIAVSAPYMHDGRFTTLKQVLDFYDNDVQDSKNLAKELKKNGELGIPLTEYEKKMMIIFLNTLTDNDFLTNKKFQP